MTTTARVGSRCSVLFSIGFRPFFAAGAIYGVVSIVVWVAALRGLTGGWLPDGGVWWHVHEMLYGFLVAALAGFMLTAVAAFTGRPAIGGVPLVIAVVLWTAGRVAMAAPHVGELAALVDIAFPVFLLVLVARELVAVGNRRNYPLAGLVGVLAAIDVGFHAARLGVIESDPLSWLLAGIYLLALLLTVIAGRIVPAFTTNWLRARGAHTFPSTTAWVERTVPLLVVATAVADLFGAAPRATALLAGGCAVVHAIRLGGWRGLATRTDPLLVVLHLGYAWLVVGFALLAAARWGGPISGSAAFHALTVGAMGTMVLAVMSRVALGHTGRALRAAPATVVAYVCISAAAILRVVAGLVPAYYIDLLAAASLAWAVALLLFVWVYLPVILAPRVDATGPSSPPDAGGA